MAEATTETVARWHMAWFAFDDVTYLNAAAQGPMPKASLEAVQTALEWKKFPHKTPDSAYFEVPRQVRASIAALVGGRADEIALTTGASAGLATVAYGLPWKTGDEVVTAEGEFPLQFTTWKPLEAREGIRLRVVRPRDRFITADDLIGALTQDTRLVSVSLVRFDDGSLLDAARLGAACRARDVRLLLDLSQCCGALPIDLRALGADFAVSAGYKWLLSPYGTGFFWVRSELVDWLKPGPFYWMALPGSDLFHELRTDDARPVPGARRWDAPETSSYFNLAGMNASLDFISRVRPETVVRHNRALIDALFERLPQDRYLCASPREAARRGPFGCFKAQTPEATKSLHDRLRAAGVIVSLRQGSLRVSPHLYNTQADIDRLVDVATDFR
jgi:cysteine desulfurase / selenocysteine lyase